MFTWIFLDEIIGFTSFQGISSALVSTVSKGIVVTVSANSPKTGIGAFYGATLCERKKTLNKTGNRYWYVFFVFFSDCRIFSLNSRQSLSPSISPKFC